MKIEKVWIVFSISKKMLPKIDCLGLTLTEPSRKYQVQHNLTWKVSKPTCPPLHQKKIKIKTCPVEIKRNWKGERLRDAMCLNKRNIILWGQRREQGRIKLHSLKKQDIYVLFIFYFIDFDSFVKPNWPSNFPLNLQK